MSMIIISPSFGARIDRPKKVQIPMISPGYTDLISPRIPR
jgi:hypothetical protein